MAKKHNTVAGGTTNAMKRLYCPRANANVWHNKRTKKNAGSATQWRCTCCGIVRE